MKKKILIINKLIIYMLVLTIKDMARRDLFLRKLNEILEMKKVKLLEQYERLIVLRNKPVKLHMYMMN